MRNKDLIQRAIHSCMNRIGLPYNGAFKVKYNDKTEFCKICKGIDGYYERSRASILAKYKKPRNSIDNVIKSKKSNKVVFNFIMELNQLTTLSYGKLMQYYPDLNKIKSFIDYQQVVGNAKKVNVDKIMLNHAKQLNLDFN